ncbi:hypothetical protein CR513_56783, partial [Mucuna pruriens]
SSTDPLHDLDPEIEITLCRLRKARNIVVSNSNSSNFVSSSNNSSPVTNNSDSFEYSCTNGFTESEQMENNDQTLKELATPHVVYQPWCIQYPQLEPAQTYELKSGLIHLLPKFHGLTREDPHKHLKKFHVVCSTMRPQGIPEDYIKMKVFTFSLDGAAKDWLSFWHHELQPSGKKFVGYNNILERLCMNTRKDSTSYAPHVHIIISYFYEGLIIMDRSMIEAASGGASMDKTLTTARHLISNIASNTQQFGIKRADQPWMVNEIGAVENLRLDNQLTELTSLVRQLVVGQHQPSIAAKICGICTSMEHPTNMCPTLQETESDHLESVGAIGGYQYEKQPHQSRQFIKQYGKQPFRPGPSQGPYAAQL